jgi:peptide/nickel transport system substrate-binding protein
MNKKNIIIGLLILLALIGYIKKDFVVEKTKDLIFSGQQYKEDILNIVLSSPETSLSPYSLNLNDLIRTANVYQGLVSFDKNLKITPALAVSWGNIDEKTWEFKLRKGVLFHDKSDFTAESIKENYEAAKNEIPTILDSISEIKIIDPYNIQIVTKDPDPLLLSKLTKFFISRSGNIGTGPYKIREWVKGEKLDLTAFTDYWGAQPAYRNVAYNVISGMSERQKDFTDGSIDILTAVPQEEALELPRDQVKTSYSLEVNFLMFKMDDELFSQRNMREAIKSIFDPAQIESIGNHFVRQATQFVAPGVYGYNPDIQPFKFDESKRATNLFGDRLEKITLDYISSYRTLGEYLLKQLREAGFSVKNSAITPEELLNKIKNNDSRFFLAGWQAEDGDAGGFLNAFIHSGGEYNGGRYKNENLDRMIEESNKEMNPEKRLKLLQEIMKKIDEELIGVPLFESSRLYAVKQGVIWEPRLDGLVLAAEVN